MQQPAPQACLPDPTSIAESPEAGSDLPSQEAAAWRLQAQAQALRILAAQHAAAAAAAAAPEPRDAAAPASASSGAARVLAAWGMPRVVELLAACVRLRLPEALMEQLVGVCQAAYLQVGFWGSLAPSGFWWRPGGEGFGAGDHPLAAGMPTGEGERREGRPRFGGQPCTRGFMGLAKRN